MVTFKAILDDFQQYVLKKDPTINEAIAATSKLGIEGRLQIYQKGYYLRLLEVLTFDFPMLKCYIGDTDFDRLGRAYIDAHPSCHPSVLSFGFAFPDFLKKQGALSEDQLELAQFELTMEKARLASATFSFPVEQLRGIAPDGWASLTFDVNPSACLFESFWGSPMIWKAIANDLPVPSSHHLAQKWLIWGKSGTTHFYAVDLPSVCFFEAIRSGKCFGEVCDALCEQMPEEEVGAFAGNCLNQWVHDQIIVAFSISEEIR